MKSLPREKVSAMARQREQYELREKHGSCKKIHKLHGQKGLLAGFVLTTGSVRRRYTAKTLKTGTKYGGDIDVDKKR